MYKHDENEDDTQINSFKRQRIEEDSGNKDQTNMVGENLDTSNNDQIQS